MVRKTDRLAFLFYKSLVLGFYALQLIIHDISDVFMGLLITKK